LALLLIMTLTIAFLIFIAWSAGYGLRRYQQHQVALALTATPLWAEYYARQTATAQAGATVPATSTPAPEPIGRVIGTANLRSEPRVAPETVLGVLEAGDRVVVLETQTVADQAWHRISLRETSGALVPGTEGWINGALLAMP